MGGAVWRHDNYSLLARTDGLGLAALPMNSSPTDCEQRNTCRFTSYRRSLQNMICAERSRTLQCETSRWSLHVHVNISAKLKLRSTVMVFNGKLTGEYLNNLILPAKSTSTCTWSPTPSGVLLYTDARPTAFRVVRNSPISIPNPDARFLIREVRRISFRDVSNFSARQAFFQFRRLPREERRHEYSFTCFNNSSGPCRWSPPLSWPQAVARATPFRNPRPKSAPLPSSWAPQ